MKLWWFEWDLVRERVPEKEQTKENDTILVKTCIDPVAIKTYEDLKVLIQEKYPNASFTFKQELYPVPFWRDVCSFCGFDK